MKEYGNDESWMKLFTIYARTPNRYIEVVNIFEDDQVLLESMEECIREDSTWKLIVYDTKHGTYVGYQSNKILSRS